MHASTRKGFVQSAPTLLQNLSADAAPGWGVMTAQHMVEHLADLFMIASNKIQLTLVTPAEHLHKYMEFLRSDKQFRENTKAPESILGDIPPPLRTASLEEAISKVETELQAFFDYFKENPGATTMHPVFGALNFEDWMILHEKHLKHHYRQFGIG